MTLFNMDGKVTKSQKWLIQGQVEYFTPFTMLWIALLNWCKEQENFSSSTNTDKAIIDYLKSTDANEVKEMFTRKLRASDEFRRILGDLAEELDGFELNDNRDNRISFADLKATRREDGYECGRYKFSYSENDIYERLLDCIYQVRCNYIHGNFDPDDESTRIINEKAYLLLNFILKDIISI